MKTFCRNSNYLCLRKEVAIQVTIETKHFKLRAQHLLRSGDWALKICNNLLKREAAQTKSKTYWVIRSLKHIRSWATYSLHQVQATA